MPTNLLLMA